MTDRIRLRQICLVVPALEPAIDQIIDVFGLLVCFGKADLTRYGVPYVPPAPFQAAFFEKHGLLSAQLAIGDTFLELVAPKRPETPAHRFLERRGPGGYMVITEVEDTSRFAERVAAAGARYAGIVDYPTYHELQVDPRDVGASMLSFSMQREGKPFDGGWYPGGPDWRSKSAPGYRAITAAELAVKDPEATSARWASLIGRPVEQADGILRIELEGSQIRFVPDTEGRPDRLDTIYLASSNFDAAITRAMAAGHPVAEGAITLCGLKFRAADPSWR